ncbi:MAG: TetM/TetW/TetO/TetS family tetracycline resistance ribosomal protection protein [Eubacteriales bacterium]|nr:TetM/TetW/TetO/TetS family tetracycline resistance ribosomal protection protein [Eubacteriales bacterium]
MDKHICVGLLAHVDSGKTTLSEALLYKTGAIRSLGRVDNRNAFLDTNAMERARGITIFSKQAQLKTEGLELTILDTPGHVDFSAEMERTLQVLDYAVLVINGSEGVQGHTETLWRLLLRLRIPVFIFVNKMDQSQLRRNQLMEQLRNKLSSSCVDFTTTDYEEIAMCQEEALEYFLENDCVTDEHIRGMIADRKLFPVYFGSALKLEGIDELISGLSKYSVIKKYPKEFGAKVYKIARDEQGNRLTFLKVTGGVLKTRQQIGDEKINQLRVYSGDKFTPAMEVLAGHICAAAGLMETYAGQGLGTEHASEMPVLEPVLNYELLLPADVDAVQLLPKLRQLEEEEPELHIVWNPLLKKIQVQIMGTVQIEVLQSLIRERYGVEVTFGTGSIVYKETIKNIVEGVGHFEPLRHYAEVHLLLEPKEAGSGLEILSDCSEDMLDRNWQRLILTHLHEKEHIGVLAGMPITDMRITLKAGKAHQKHTEGGDFRQATYRALRQGLMQAESVLLEPFYSFTLELPLENVGRAMSDLERMHAVFTLEQNGTDAGKSVITGLVPVSTLGDYQTEVIAYTKGQGQLSCCLKGYGPCHNEAEVIEQIGYDAESDVENTSASVFCSHGAGFTVNWREVPSYMHLESILGKKTDEESALTGKQLSRRVSDEPMGTDEIDAILKETYFANSKAQSNKWKRKGGIPEAHFVYKGKEQNQNTNENYLLVDGYNIIFAWKELSELAKVNIDGARGRLLDIMCNYQGMKKCRLIVVFDAYRVKGHDEEILDYNNIHVVYTREAETADHYIERFAHENGRKYNVRVATSDGLEQIIIRGNGCRLVSAREFEMEVYDLEQSIRDEYLGKSY